MECPGCGKNIEEGAWICPSCEYIVDASFLGPNITNEARAKAAAAAADPLFDDPTEDAIRRAQQREDRDDPDAPTASLEEDSVRGIDVGDDMILGEADPPMDPREAGPADDELPTGDLDGELAPQPVMPRPMDPPDEAPALEPVMPQPMDPPDDDDGRDTNVLPDEVLPSSGPQPLDPGLLEEVNAKEPPPLVINKPKKKKGKGKGLPKAKKNGTGDLEADAKKREVLQRAMARASAVERRRSVTGDIPSTKPKTRDIERRAPEEPKPVIRSPKAEKIFQQALEDIEAGNLPSARTNIKLAITFDPGNERYAAKLASIMDDEPEGAHLDDVQKGVQFANQYFEKAKEAETNGDYEEAIKQLERAIRADPQGVYYNHLGQILAFEQGELKEGKRMVEKAIQLSPRNKNYQKNLSKILSKMGVGDDRKNVAGMLSGLLNKRK